MKKMKWSSELEGAEVLYAEGWEFDMFGPGIVQGIETRNDSTSMVEILFPDSQSISRQFLALDVFMERLKQGRIVISTSTDENSTLHQWRVRERELVNEPQEKALIRILSFSEFERAFLVELLKKRVEDESRLNREKAVILLGKLGTIIDKEGARDLFRFLLEQTKGNKKRRSKGPQPYSSYALSVAGQSRREQCELVACHLFVAARMAREMGDEEMRQAVERRARSLQNNPSTIIKKAAKAVLLEIKEGAYFLIHRSG